MDFSTPASTHGNLGQNQPMFIRSNHDEDKNNEEAMNLTDLYTEEQQQDHLPLYTSLLRHFFHDVIMESTL